MSNDLDKQLARFTALMVGIQAGSILAILGLFLAFNYFVKVRLANLAQQEARHAILAGDLRQAISLLDDIRDGEFRTIRYFDGSGRILFSIPPESEEKAAPSSLFFDIANSMELKPSEGSSEALGRLEFVFSIFNGMSYVLIAAVLLIAGSVPLANRYRRKLQDRYKLELTARSDAAVARMTGMLAHDVRKPFSILRMALGMLGNAKDPASVKKVLGRIVPEIDKAVSSVDGLIADVMEVGSTSPQLIQEPASPESLIEATLGETFRIYPKADIAITYDLRHTHMVNVHVQKVGRVFSNIVSNAVQAMGQKGILWFKTRERDGLIEFCLGNAGSVIPPESLPKLFDAFFTSGKKGGTGLGLAIAEKVVKAHGGRIWCESSKTLEHPDGKVEFIFTLPVAEGHRSKTTTSLPRHSSDITRMLLAIADTQASEGSVDKGELTLEADIIQTRDKLGRALRVLVVDDEAVYRSALAAYLSRTQELSGAIDVAQADGSGAALGAVEKDTYDLVITDVDMGPDSLDGFGLVRELRARGLASLICVHSNRIVSADHKNATAAGADAFLPKPVARAQLLRLALQAAQVAQQQLAEVRPLVTAAQRQGAVAADKAMPEILVLDDNPFILDAWADTLKPAATVHLLTSLEQLTERLETDPDFIKRLSCVVTDMHFDGSTGDGLDVGRLLKSRRPTLPVLLSSDGRFQPGELVGAIDLVISKDPVELRELVALNS